uniref:BRCT domain-containing protein n=1 Tax=Dunaliella tertiolecta TaxID=3047 RepID=A0A7S3VUG6_DUNTE
MDIRRFLTKPGGGSAAPPPKDKNEGKMVVTPNKPKSPVKKGASPTEKKATQKGGGASKDEGGPETKKSRYFSEDGGGPSAAAAGKPPAHGPAKTEPAEKGGPSKRPRKKAIVESDDEDVESDEDVEMQDLKNSSSDDDDDVQMVDSSDDDGDRGSKKTKNNKKKQQGAKMVVQPSKQAPAAPASGGKTKKRDRDIKVVDLGDDDDEAGPSNKKKAVGDKKPKAATPSSASKPVAPRAPKALATSSGKKTKPPTAPALSEDAQAAIAAVDAAAQKLPDESAVKFSFMPEGATGPPQSEPPNLNNKEVPEGHPEALHGKTFVISGVPDSLFRETATDLIKKHSGKVTQAVSGKTTFLMVGHDCGRSKYHDAKRHGTKLIDEDGLFSLIRATSHLVPKEEAPPLPKPDAPSLTPAAAAAGPSRAAASSPAMQVARPPPSVPAESQLWVDKHKPRTSKDLVGNQGHIRTLQQWLLGWEAVQLHGAEAGTAGTQARPKDLSKKAVLIAGPPGTGKTSTAHIISRWVHWDWQHQHRTHHFQVGTLELAKPALHTSFPGEYTEACLCMGKHMYNLK